ncbi:MAG: 3-oxoacyl-ACP reductase FabG [Chloroflexi bacterium]|nr:3-oxoacyl-ACP reductase FabG [Chloroflexota bacterium]
MSGPSSGRVALVTGAARGIGRAICERLAADGAAVAVNYASDGRAGDAAAVVAAITAAGGRAMVVQADVSDAAQVARMVSLVADELGPVTILVNNAAITKVHGPWTDIDEARWDDVMDTNAKGVYLCCRAVHPGMVAAGWGRIINIASVTFLTGQANLAHYVASKGAMIGFTRSLARSVGPEGITVNSISPGAIQSDVEMELTTEPGQREQLALDMARLQSVPRRGLPADIAGAVAFLASDDASFISGQLLNVDGGWAMH